MIKKVVVSAVLFLSALTAYAGDQLGAVKDVIIRASDGLVYVYLLGTMNSKPSCSTGYYWVIKDENSAAGKKQLAALLAAQLANRNVHLIGMGTCSRWSDGEDIDSVIVSNTNAPQ